MGADSVRAFECSKADPVTDGSLFSSYNTGEKRGTDRERDPHVGALSSARALNDVGPIQRVLFPDLVRKCLWCRRPLEEGTPIDQVFDGRKCRQSAWRLRRLLPDLPKRANPKPLRFAYADPPYPGLAKRYYQHEPTYAGEVDHAELIASLKYYDGWALSTSGKLATLAKILPLCPQNAILVPWVKLGGVPSTTRGLHNRWEALIVVPGRALRPGQADFLIAHPARFGGTLTGRKPIAFIAKLFKALGMLVGDSLLDKYPGTEIVGRSWAVLSSLRYRQASSSPDVASLRTSTTSSKPSAGGAR
jgi:hypothetical protein